MSLTMKIYIIKDENTDLFLKNKRKTPVTIQIHVVYVTATNHGRTICFVFTLIEGKNIAKHLLFLEFHSMICMQLCTRVF